MHHDPAVEAELHVEFIGISRWTCVVDEIDITLGLTGIVGVSFCFEEILFRQRQQALRDIALEVSQVDRVLFSALAQDKTACSCGRLYVSQGAVWGLRRQFSTTMVSSARTPAREFARSPVRSAASRAALPRRLLHRSRVCHAATRLTRGLSNQGLIPCGLTVRDGEEPSSMSARRLRGRARSALSSQACVFAVPFAFGQFSTLVRDHGRYLDAEHRHVAHVRLHPYRPPSQPDR